MKPKVTTLKNGARIVTIHNNAFQTVTALVLVGTGSAYEKKEENGLSHFLEHMCFKGTQKYPSAKIISETLESLGAVSNAFTSLEYTGYYVKGNPAHTDIFLSVLGDIYQHGTFPEGEIEKEKGVIIEEIKMYEDLPHYKAADELMTLMYGDQPAGRSTLGTKESVMSFSRKDYLSYKTKHYHAENTVVIVCGPEDKAMTKKVQQYFGGIDSKKGSRKAKTITKQSEFAFRIVRKPIDQAHVSIGFHSVAYRHKDMPAVRLLSTILGRGMSSRLFQLIREELGVAYSVSAYQESFLDHGIFNISAGLDKARINEVLPLIAGELARIKTELVTQTELAKAKEYTAGTFRLGLETSDDIANFYGTQLVLKKPIKEPRESLREYMAITPSDIRRVAKKLFSGKNASLVVVGDYTDGEIDTSPLAVL